MVIVSSSAATAGAIGTLGTAVLVGGGAAAATKGAVDAADKAKKAKKLKDMAAPAFSAAEEKARAAVLLARRQRSKTILTSSELPGTAQKKLLGE